MSENGEKDCDLFNGRRNADQYVRGYLKGILVISGLGLTLMLATGTWLTKSVINHDLRITSIESSRFTIADGAALAQRIADNKLAFARIEQQLVYNAQDMKEIKELLKRSMPLENRRGN